ncbi:hypothetical protein V8E53_003073 [Lactarius tabidus]
MSAFLGEYHDDPGIADSQHTPGSPQSMPSRAPHGSSNFFDDSGPLISKYVKWAEEYDKQMAQNWKEEADKVFLFTGLFSAVIATMISLSIQDIQQNPQTISNFYLANIQQALSDSKPRDISLLPSTPTFTPPATAVWVNSLWFLSLAINLTCSVLASLQQRWALKYLKATHPRFSPRRRARTRAFYARGVEKYSPRIVFATLPVLLHLSFFLFAAGLVVFLWHLDLILSKVLVCWVAVCLLAYYYFTLCPFGSHDSPYDTPLSMPMLYLWTRIHFLIVWNLRQFTCFGANSRLATLERKYRKLLVQGFLKTANRTALKSPFCIDAAFLNDLDEDNDMDQILSGIPTFHGPKPADDPQSTAKAKQMKAFVEFLDTTFSSDLLPDLSKERRAIFNVKALEPADLPNAYLSILNGVVSGDHFKGIKSAEFGRFMRGWSRSVDDTTPSVVQAICSGIVAKPRPHFDSWIAFASLEMGVQEGDLRGYSRNRDNLSLAIFLHIVRQQFSHIGDSSWPVDSFSKVLEAAPKFKAQNALPALQHKFCTLWNEIVLKARTDDNWTIAGDILGKMHGVYKSLHPDTNSAPTRPPAPGADNVVTYPECNVPDHADPTPTGPFDSDVPPPVNEAHVPGPSHLARETPIQGLRPADAFPGPSVPRVTGSIDTSIVTIPLTTLAPSASAPAPSSAHNGRRTSPDDPGIPGSHSSAPVPTAPVPAGGEGSAKAASHKTIDALQPSSAIHTASPDHPPQSDVIAPGSSRRSLSAECTADHPLHPSHDQSNMV